jgi:hypothetical protein
VSDKPASAMPVTSAGPFSLAIIVAVGEPAIGRWLQVEGQRQQRRLESITQAMSTKGLYQKAAGL